MSKHEIVKSLKVEIRKINRLIDRKILMGAPYALEARRHKFLMSQLRHLVPERSGFMGRIFGFAI